jgi:hypothetical protein
MKAANNKTRRSDMKTNKMLAAGLAALAVGLLAGRAQALPTPTAVLSIDVTVTNSLSVKIDESDTSSRTLTVQPGGNPVVNAATSTVASDATAISEYWKLNAADAVSLDGATKMWDLQTSSKNLGTDQFALQALLISKAAAQTDCPNGTNTAWDQVNAPPLGRYPGASATFTAGAAGHFAYQSMLGGFNGDPDFTAGGNNGRMKPGSQRGLCYRIVPPSDVTSANHVKTHVIITASYTP